MIGHITATELRHHVNPVELANGLLNRFLLLGCRLVRLLPEGGHPDPLHATGLPQRLTATLTTARRAGQLLNARQTRLGRGLPTARRTPARDRRSARRSR